MLKRILLSSCFVGAVLASPTLSPESRQIQYVYPSEDGPSSAACLSLQNSCNANRVDLNDFYSYVPCIMLTTCLLVVDGYDPAQVLAAVSAPANQSRLTEEIFYSMSDGNTYMTQQNYIDAYYGALSQTPNGTYPDNVTYVEGQWQEIAAWTGFCDTLNIPYSNFADWLEYSSVPGVCGAVGSCDPTLEATLKPCVPQPITDNGSCAEMVSQCQLWVTSGLFQNEFCVLASFCYAWTNTSTDVLLLDEYPSYLVAPTTSQQVMLSEDVFYNMTGGAPTMSQQNAIDAYYGALTGTWISLGGPFGAMTPTQTTNDGPYPTSSQYVVDFWAIISAWTGFCDTLEIPYSNLADYLSYAAGSGYHPTC